MGKESATKKKKKKKNASTKVKKPEVQEEKGLMFANFDAVSDKSGRAAKGSGVKKAKAGRVKTAKVGDTVSVEGYDCHGTVRFVGKHTESGKPRYGVELDEPVGKNNGTVKGHFYFQCPKKCGILTIASKLTTVTGSSSFASKMDAEMAAFEGDMGGFDESPAMLDAGREPSAELQPAPDPESEPEPETIHEWLDAVVPG